MLPFWWQTATACYRITFATSPTPRDFASLYSFILIFVILVGGFSFVHHRYLFPITALVMIGGAARRENNPNEKDVKNTLQVCNGTLK